MKQQQNYLKFLCIIFLFTSPSLVGQEITPELINELKQQQSIQRDDTVTSNLTLESSVIESEKEIENTVEPEESDIFGVDYINSIPTSIAASSDLPVPNGYKISFKDQIELILSGNKNNIYTINVGLDGSILIPELGKLQVVGDDFSEVKRKIANLISISYVGVDVDISLSNLSAKKISIVGAVKQPGTYLVNPFTTISNSLAFSGGLEDFSSLRNIILIRNNERYSFDLYDLLIFGDRTKDLVIEQGDTILVTATTNHVEITGEVLRPKTYEYSSTDSYSDLITFAQGFKPIANPNEVTIQEYFQGSINSRNVSISDVVQNTVLSKLKIGRNSISMNSGIVVRGESVQERFFTTEEFKYLNELVDELNFSFDIYPFYAKLIQDSNSGLSKETVSFSLADRNSYKEIKLKNNVEITFFSRDDIDDLQEYFVEKLNLNLIDSSNNNLNFKDNTIPQESQKLANLIRLTDLKIISFGEITYLAPFSGQFIPKAVFNFYGKDQNFEESLVTVSTDDGLLASSVNDSIDSSIVTQINFPEPKSTKFLLEISGQVNNPGLFSVSSNMTLEDAYKISGGLTNRADSSSIILLREEIKQREKSSLQNAKRAILDSVISQIGNPLNNATNNAGDLLPIIDIADNIDTLGRLAGDISPGSANAKNITLEQGDILYIPSKSFSVTVLGEVLQPITTTFNSNFSLKDYIEFAGGLTSFADKGNIYVIKSNGTSVPVSYRALGNYKPMPGDSLIIPRNLEKLNAIPLISTSVKIISDIAFAAASLNVLRN